PHQAHERRRLTTRNDEPVEPVELLRLAHLDDVRAEAAQHRRVLAEVPLHCEDADRHGRNASRGLALTRFRTGSRVGVVRRALGVVAAAVFAVAAFAVGAPAASAPSFTSEQLAGTLVDDNWEPTTAADPSSSY